MTENGKKEKGKRKKKRESRPDAAAGLGKRQPGVAISEDTKKMSEWQTRRLFLFRQPFTHSIIEH